MLASQFVHSPELELELEEEQFAMSDIARGDSGGGQEIVVTDVRIPFLSMVVLMIKWVIASIPALIILSMIGAMIGALVGGMGLVMG